MVASARNAVPSSTRQRTRAAPPVPPALAPVVCTVLLNTLNSERFADCAPFTVYATLLDEERYLASLRNIYRLLAQDGRRWSTGPADPPGLRPPEAADHRPSRA